MKKCPVCGHAMEDEACFCSACGEKMPEPSPAKEPGKEAPPSSKDGARKKSVSCKPFIIIGVVILALLALIADLLIFTDAPEDVLKKEVAAYCAEQFPTLKIEAIQIGEIEKSLRSSYRRAEVTLTIDGALTVSEYDNLYSYLSWRVFDSQIQVDPLKIVEDSGNDYESGYWDRQRAAATPAPTLSSQSNSGVSEEDAKWAVYLMAEETIPKYLNCPSTMEMGLFRDCTIKDVGFNIWKGEGYFDAENLYGATVRSKWNITCTIKDGIIHLAKLKIDDIVVYNDGTQ